MLGLTIPSSDIGGGERDGFILSESPSSVQRGERLGKILDDDDEGFNFEPGFSIDADGNVIEEGHESDDVSGYLGCQEPKRESRLGTAQRSRAQILSIWPSGKSFPTHGSSIRYDFAMVGNCCDSKGKSCAKK